MRIRQLILGVCVGAAVLPASGTVISFDFNTIPLTGNGVHNSSAHPDGLSNAADSSLIQSYMQGVLTGLSIPSTVTVSGALAASGYTADGFEYGPTLGTSDGATSYSDNSHPSQSAPDVFIMNDDFGLFGSASHSITIQFSNIALGTVTFDWQIFPDGNCGACSSTNGNFPDLDFSVDGVHQGATPTFSAAVIAGHDAQQIGTGSFVLDLAAGTHTLTFEDWPPEIGVDRLTINTCSSRLPNCTLQEAPEPSPLALFGLALGLLALVQARARVRS